MLKKIQKEVEDLRIKVYAGQSLEDTEKALYEIEQMLFKAMDEQLNIPIVSGSTFSIEELHVLHSGLIAAKPKLNERTRGYKETLTLIDKLSLMISEYYR